MKYTRMIKIAVCLAVTCFLLGLPTLAQAVSSILDVRITDSRNDAEESDTGMVTLDESVLDLGGAWRRVGLRFTNIQIPRYTPITKAYIEFTAADQDSGTLTLKFQVEAADNAAMWTLNDYNISNRNTYSTNVYWTVDYDWQNAGQTHQTSDLKALVQKVVSRKGWQSGNSMAFIISTPHTTNRRAKSGDLNLAEAAKLHIEYAANVLEVPIQVTSDDMYHNAGASSGRTYDSDAIRIGSTATTTEWYSGFRFTDVDIPQGAVINFANVNFVAYSDYATAQTGTAAIRGEARLNPPTFSTLDQNIDAVARRARSAAVPKTATTVTWTNFPAWTINTTYASPDITPIIQEIIGQAGWDTSDKSLVLLLGPNGLNPHRLVWGVYSSTDMAPVLHIEWGAGTGGGGTGGGGTGGGGTGGGGTGGGGTGVPVMSPSTLDIGRSAFQGALVQAFPFDMMNSGQAALNYTVAVTYNNGSGWLTLSPAAATGSVAPGEKQTFTVDFNTAGLTPGTHEAMIRFTDANASNSPQDIRVSLSILAQAANTCNEAPLYTKSVSSPAVMVLLDCSGSMAWGVDLVDPKDTSARTPDLKEVVQELVNQDAWLPGYASAFFIEHVSGDGRRYARSFEGNSASAPLLHVEYTANGQSAQVEARVAQAADDGYGNVYGYNFYTYDSNLVIAEPGAGSGVGMRFEGLTIPKKATITKAYIQFVPSLTQDAPLQVRISAEANTNSPSFAYNIMEMSVRQKTAASVTWDVPAWTGVTVETRMNVAKTVIGEMFKDPSIAWGFGRWTSEPPWSLAADGSCTLIDAGCRPNMADQQTRLQAALSSAVPGGWTPFSPSLTGAKLYFEGKKKDDNTGLAGYEDGEVYAPVACQPKFLIEVTDGQGNQDSTVENVKTRVGALADAGVSTVGIGFGLSTEEADQLYALAEVANTRGKASTSDMLYAMHQEDSQTGKPLPYMTYNKDQLVSAFKSIMGTVKGIVFYGSAPAATTSTDLGDSVLVASFTSGNWAGELQAITKSTNGLWTSSIWKATEHIPSPRSVWTVDGSKNMTAYSDSTLSGDNWMCKQLGDIIHSTPVVVGAPPYFYTFDQYNSFKRDKTVTHPRESLVYVGSNDGLLHAFSLKDGKEKWAFLPYSLQAKLNLAANGGEYDMCSSAYCHQYLLDGSPQVADVYGKFGGTDKWRTILMIGQRAGGTAYTALDVTSGESPDPSNPDPAKFLWEFTDPELGETWSEPAIERVADATGQAGAATWGAFFGSGYHEVDNLQASKEAILFGIQADTGTGLWKDGTTTVNKIKMLSDAGTIGYCNAIGGNFVVGEVVTGRTSKAKGKVAAVTGQCPGTLNLNNLSGTNFQVGEYLDGDKGHSAPVTAAFTVTTSVQKNNALASSLVVNFSTTDKIEDAIYTGDLYGNMFRVDSIGKGQAPSVSRLFKFNPYPSSPDEHPIRAKASNAYGKTAGSMWVYFGTGRYETQADSGSKTQQYFFGLKDGTTPRVSPYTVADLKPLEARFTSATVGSTTLKLRTVSGTNAGGDPWALNLFAGPADWGGPASASGSERVFTKALTVGGIVFFTTFIPDATTCGGSGDTWVFALDYATGLPPANPVFDLDGDKKFTENDKVEVNGKKVVPVGIYIGRGQGSSPVIFRDTLFVTTSTPQFKEGDPNAGGGVGGGDVTGLNALLVNIPQKKVRVESWKHN